MRKSTYHTVNEPKRSAVTRKTVRELASDPSLRSVARIAGKYAKKSK